MIYSSDGTTYESSLHHELGLDHESTEPVTFKADPTIDDILRDFNKKPDPEFRKKMQDYADAQATVAAQDDPSITLRNVPADLSNFTQKSKNIEDRTKDTGPITPVTEKEGRMAYIKFLSHNDIDPNSAFANQLGSNMDILASIAGHHKMKYLPLK